MNQLAKAHLQQVQNQRQVNAMEGVNMLVNKRRQRAQQNQVGSDQFDNDCGGFQDDGYDGQNEEVQYVNNYQEVRIDIQDIDVETQNGVNPSREHSLSINVPLVEALEQMSGYAKFMKDLVTKKRSMDCETIKMTYQVSAIVQSMAPKLEDPGAFTIPYTIGSADFAKALCDLGASINLLPHSVFKTLGIGQPRLTSMRLQMTDRTMKRPLEFDLEIVDQKGSEDQVADHLSRLEEERRPRDGLDINDSFPYEQLLSVSVNGMPLFADVANFLVTAVALPNNEALSAVTFLKKSIFNRTDWSKKLDDALWSYMISYKTPIGMSLYRLVFGKACHLPIELENKAMWALRKLNLEWDMATNLHVEQHNELDEFRFHAYSSSFLYKDKIKYLHDKYDRSK
ncbi:uncharacterized protein [Nicotiana sylvestris]|uniref:uncharacterized protein n=1 Tax=Nicotiana sylvestris TaxID=4096 RepID=UPI00388C6D1A